MTTIAWDGKSIAADKLCGGRYTVNKIWKLPDGSVIGGAGLYDHIVEVVAWIAEGGNEDKRPKLPESQEEGSDLLLVDADGKAYWLTWPYLRKVPITEKYEAIGSGSEFALGAMAMGASAQRAVQIASRFDPNTGRGVTVAHVGKQGKK